jgi:hypothetical protein
MNRLSSLIDRPVSDLWLPMMIAALVLLALLGFHFLWLNWRLKRLQHKLNLLVNKHSPPHTEPAKVANTAGLSDILALTAQKHPVSLEERLHQETAYVPSSEWVAQRLDPMFDANEMLPDTPLNVPSSPAQGLDLSQSVALSIAATPRAQLGAVSEYALDSITAPTPAFLPALAPVMEHPLVAAMELAPANELIECIGSQPKGGEPLSSVLLPKESVPTALEVHPVFHYSMRFIWADFIGQSGLDQALIVSPWLNTLPVIWRLDKVGNAGEHLAIASLQVASRQSLASESDCEQFKQWCQGVATQTAAQCELLALAPWDAFIDEAHSLLIGLDSAIVLKIAVPLVQLDLFTQAMLAARFTQSNEHWVYQEPHSSSQTWIERLWQQASGDSAGGQQAVFQVMIDIPHLDAFEARKIYMRLRAVARTSAAILQSAQGVHLAEGMLDRYSRELMMKQEALSKAGVVAGTPLAKQLFAPKLTLSTGLATV